MRCRCYACPLPSLYLHMHALQVLCTPAAGAAKAAAAKSENGEAAKVSQTYLIATKELRVVAAGTSAAQCFLSNVFPEQGGVVGMPAGMQITACDAQARYLSLPEPPLCLPALSPPLPACQKHLFAFHDHL
jgi:hypothetical protein